MTALQQKFLKVMAVLPKRPKSRYQYIQVTANANGFDKGNIIRLANFLIISGECKSKSEAFSKAWELAKNRKAQFVQFTDISWFVKSSKHD